MNEDGTPNTCHCPCMCDPTVARQFEQTSGRYNDRSAFAGNLQQDSVVQMQNQFQAKAQNQLETNPADRLMSSIAQLMTLLRAPAA